VILRRFLDRDHRPRFTRTGEPTPWPEVMLYDRSEGEAANLDDFIEMDPSRRWLLVLDYEQLWLIDGNTGAHGTDRRSSIRGSLPARFMGLLGWTRRVT
jgi:hypothetical protein